jgi:general secretion pathway protein A
MSGHVTALGFRAGILGVVLIFGSPAYAVNEAETAEYLIKLVKAGRVVVSENQALINDATKGDKGFTPDVFGQKTAQKFFETTRIDLNKAATNELTRLLHALLDSGKQVVAEAQVIINKQGLGFKGFLPAVWNRKTGEIFQEKTGIRLKLTNADYRNPKNKPDEFEEEVLKLFSDPSYPKGKEYSRMTVMSGKPALRFMSPEYASKACLSCHGEPKGERDITGSKKEGWKEGGLAGAISLIIPVK